MPSGRIRACSEETIQLSRSASVKIWFVRFVTRDRDRRPVRRAKSRGTVMNVSRFGAFLFGDSASSGAVDPFLEDPNTLWLLHWFLISNFERSTTWQWAFNRFPSNEFTRDGLLQSVQENQKGNVTSPSESTLKRDIEVFIAIRWFV